MTRKHDKSFHKRARVAAALAVVAAVALPATPAFAKAKTTASYRFDQVWPAAVRFLRIDEGFEIVEKEQSAGYVIFRVAEEGKTFEGALELIRTKDDRGRPAVDVVVRIEGRPYYMERGVLDRFARKLRDELGDPPPPPPADDGDDGDDGARETRD